MRFFGSRLTAILVALGLLLPQVQAHAEETTFSDEQLEQLVAPIALYPDSLVAQILMAATYPLEIVEADRWRQKNLKLADDELEAQLEEQTWDPSVVSLAYFPDVLHRLAENLDWTQDLGDAVLAQQDDVMDAVQRMRRYAEEAGNLETTEQQKVIVEKEVIRIEPVTEVVYVPTYNPTVIYGSYWSVPRYYYPIYSYPSGYWASNLISFGVGVAVGRALWSSCNWYKRDININVNHNHWKRKDVNINRNGRWQHNPSHRRNVRYKDKTTRDRVAGGDRSARDRSARGFDAKTRDAKSLQRDLKAAGDRPAKRDIGGGKKVTRDADRVNLKSMARDRDGASAKKRDLSGAKGGGERLNKGGATQIKDRSDRGGNRSTRTPGGSQRDGGAFSSNRGGKATRQMSDRGRTSRAGGGGGGRLGGGRSR